MPVILTCPNGHEWCVDKVAARTMCPTCGEEGTIVAADVLNPALVETRPLFAKPDTASPRKNDGSAADTFKPRNEATTIMPEIPEYELLSEIGRGGMGIVYKAREMSLGRVVALKMVLAGASAGSDEYKRFHSEAEVLARLQHPNLVQLYGFGEHDGKPYFSLEYMEGSDMKSKLGGKPQPPDEAARLTEILARGVHVAHQHKIIHRDLKPANVLLTADGTLKITDFGLAKRLDSAQGGTRTGAIMGTPSYMSPEQAGRR